MCCGTEAGSYLRLVDPCFTQLKAQGSQGPVTRVKKRKERDLAGVGDGEVDSASTAPCTSSTSRRMCCPTHCASYCAPCQPLWRAVLGWIRSPPSTRDERDLVGVGDGEVGEGAHVVGLDRQPLHVYGSPYQSTFDALYVYVVPWPEFPIVPSYPHIWLE
jgi:hypothetical protein